MRRFDPKWQLRRCLHCGHEEQFPALQPMEALCSRCGVGRLDYAVGAGRTMHVPICLCGCGAVLVSMVRRDTLYAGRSHSTRAWKQKTAYDARRARERAASRLPGTLLDLFCGAGGAGMGYHRAGFEIVGVDLRPQPRYPFEFHQADALEVLRILAAGGIWEGYRLEDFDVIHASPPCHAYSTVTGRNRRKDKRRYPDLLAPTRDLLVASGATWVMENVVGAPMTNTIRLCGSSFGLDVRRHRLFESSVAIMAPPCAHHLQTPRFRSLDSRMAGKLATVVGVHGHLNYLGEAEIRERAMGIDWMSQHELTQAIPPAYTEHIGGYLFTALRQEAVS